MHMQEWPSAPEQRLHWVDSTLCISINTMKHIYKLKSKVPLNTQKQNQVTEVCMKHKLKNVAEEIHKQIFSETETTITTTHIPAMSLHNVAPVWVMHQVFL